MSKQRIVKDVEAVVCDFCDQEVDVKGDDYCYHNIRTNTVLLPDKYRVNHFVFSWYRPRNKPPMGKDYIQYDFHAACFDKLMQEFLAAKAGKDSK